MIISTWVSIFVIKAHFLFNIINKLRFQYLQDMIGERYKESVFEGNTMLRKLRLILEVFSAISYFFSAIFDVFWTYFGRFFGHFLLFFRLFLTFFGHILDVLSAISDVFLGYF